MTACTAPSVVIIHPDPLVRACLAAALGASTSVSVHAVVPDPAGFDDASNGVPGGLIVADHPSALLLAASALRRHLAAGSEPRIAVVSSCDREWDLRSALAGRVRGYLAPGFEVQQLLDCVTAVQAGGRYLCPRSAARLAESLSYDALTERETATLRLVVQGLPNKSIARALAISVGTVKSHLKSAYAKLEVTSRTQAIAEVQRRGLLAQATGPGGSRAPVAKARLHALPPIASTLRLARPPAVAACALRAA